MKILSWNLEVYILKKSYDKTYYRFRNKKNLWSENASTSGQQITTVKPLIQGAPNLIYFNVSRPGCFLILNTKGQ